MRPILLLLMLLVMGIGLACNNAAKPTIVKADPPQAQPAQTESHDHAADAQAPRITLEEAKKDFDAGTAVFVDTRDSGSFELKRIKGAINIPLFTFEKHWQQIPSGKKIIAYCS